MESRSHGPQKNAVCLVSKSPRVSLSDEQGDTLGAEQNADEQYIQQLAKK